MNFEQKVILITGASSGFGKISAQILAERGHIVYGTSRKQTDSPEKVIMLAMDVTDPYSIQKIITHIYSEQGRIDVLINNAGMGIGGALELATQEEVLQQMNTNFFGVVNMCNAVLPYMRKARQGKIINISSIAGIMAVPYQGFYSASKFAIEGYSEALALELHPFHIKVCLVEPGDFKTGFTASRNISTATLNDSDYGERFAKALTLIEKAENQGSNPILLGKAMCRIVEKKKPSFRTLVGPLEQILFARVKSYLPNKVIQFILRSFYDIK
jgi:short-subunit dehydrogenase